VQVRGMMAVPSLDIMKCLKTEIPAAKLFGCVCGNKKRRVGCYNAALP